MQHVKFIVSSGTSYKKLCSMFDFLLSIYKKASNLILRLKFLSGRFLLYNILLRNRFSIHCDIPLHMLLHYPV